MESSKTVELLYSVVRVYKTKTKRKCGKYRQLVLNVTIELNVHSCEQLKQLNSYCAMLVMSSQFISYPPN